MFRLLAACFCPGRGVFLGWFQMFLSVYAERPTRGLVSVSSGGSASPFGEGLLVARDLGPLRAAPLVA